MFTVELRLTAADTVELGVSAGLPAETLGGQGHGRTAVAVSYGGSECTAGC